jgi:hypothetical protein
MMPRESAIETAEIFTVTVPVSMTTSQLAEGFLVKFHTSVQIIYHNHVHFQISSRVVSLVFVDDQLSPDQTIADAVPASS